MSTAEATATPAQKAVGQFLKAVLKSSGNKFFYVRFVKKDKSIREMQARLHVKKDQVHGGTRPSTTAHIGKYLTVFDVQHEAKRMKEMKRLAGIITSYNQDRTEAWKEYKTWLKDKSYRNINCETILDMTVKGIKHIITDENTFFLKGSENYTKPVVIVGRKA